MKKVNFVLLSIIPLILTAQQDSQVSFYQQNLQLYNPAATGLGDHPILSSSLRSQWTGVEGAPVVQAFNLSVPGGEKKLGYGAYIVVDKTFVERQTRLFSTFSYRVPVGKNKLLYLGIQGGGNHINLNYNEINVAHQDDGELENITRFYPNIGLGIHFKSNNTYFSVAAPLLFGHRKIKSNDAISSVPADDPHLYFSTGTRVPILKKHWEIIAHSLLRWVQYAPPSAVFNLGIGYQKSEFLFTHQHRTSFGLSFFFDSNGIMSAGYAYQFPTHKLTSQLKTGNHELILRIKFKPKKMTPLENKEDGDPDPQMMIN